MATRPIFLAESAGPKLVRVKQVEFVWHAGMAKSRRQMSMRSLHEAARALYPEARILEVSRMSDDPLGEQLSAFNLTFMPAGYDHEVSVECAFQASKVFERGGPFRDLLKASPADAKSDRRLQDSGRLIGFRFLEEEWPNKPLTAFYDWIYLNALHGRPKLAKAITRYNMFTDIVFNPKKSINCQAGAAALYTALVVRGELQAALSSKESFLRVAAGAITHDIACETQRSLF